MAPRLTKGQRPDVLERVESDDGGDGADVSILDIEGAEACIVLADHSQLFARVVAPLAGGRVVVVPWGSAARLTLTRAEVLRAAAANVDSWEKVRRIGARQRAARSAALTISNNGIS